MTTRDAACKHADALTRGRQQPRLRVKSTHTMAHTHATPTSTTPPQPRPAHPAPTLLPPPRSAARQPPPWGVPTWPGPQPARGRASGAPRGAAATPQQRKGEREEGGGGTELHKSRRGAASEDARARRGKGPVGGRGGTPAPLHAHPPDRTARGGHSQSAVALLLFCLSCVRSLSVCDNKRWPWGRKAARQHGNRPAPPPSLRHQQRTQHPNPSTPFAAALNRTPFTSPPPTPSKSH